MTSSRSTTPRAWIACLGGALVIFAAFVLVLERNPLEVIAAVVEGAFGSSVGINRTIARTIPLLLLSAGLLLAFRAKFWNIGLNGGMFMGAIAGTLLFGGFEAAQFRLPATFSGAQYVFGILPYLAPILTLPLIGARLRLRVSGAPAGLGKPYFREARG